jgi:uncharacterized protein YqgC (DUF456 family)
LGGFLIPEIMGWFLITLAVILLLLGLLGCIIPVLPGPPLSFIALLLAHFTRFANFENNVLITLGIIALVVQILDYIVPVWGTKKFGGTKYGTWGSIIGLLAGIFVLPALGIVIGPFGLITILAGPFFGALIGEKIGGRDNDKAMKAAIGSFIGFLTGTLMKLATSIVITVYFVKELIH